MARILKINSKEYQRPLNENILNSTQEKSEFYSTIQQYIDHINQKNNQISELKKEACELDQGLTEKHIITHLDELLK